MGDINVFLKKLYYIHTVCDDARKEKKTEDANAKQDNFTKKKKEVAMQIREVKAVRIIGTQNLSAYANTVL
jgi:hypothetical protein